MSFFRFLFNLFWFVLGGVFMGLAWWLAGLLCFVSLIGIPWGRACFVIGTFTFFPFGKQAVSRKSMTGQSDIGTGALGLIGNILWFVLIGVWLAIGHISAEGPSQAILAGGKKGRLGSALFHCPIRGLPCCPAIFLPTSPVCASSTAGP